MILVSIIIALILERLGARSAHWQISHYANSYLNRSVNLLTNKGLFGTASGFLIWLLLPVIAVACLFFLSDFALWQLVFNVAVLLVCFGCAKQRALYKSYLNALTRGDQTAATLYALQLGQKRTEEQQGGETLGQTLAWVNFRFYCAVIFWFVILGVAGAVFYALVRTFADLVSGNRDEVIAKHFKLIHRLLFWLDWLPARITSFGYLVIGNFNKGTSCWLRFVFDFSSPNRKVVTYTALAAEQVEKRYYGCTFEATCMIKLVKRNVLFYLVLIALMTLFGGLS
ncbi:Regulatory protein AmpE [Pseudoalteromonas sp. 3J6]|jgi:AmpE protein|uniref:beta-lactamase regulator AmpE n=1 Tax=unclassified Pseudoalteromonas TaxID=194690 RepID=UPI00110ACAFC|nr:MULTISPECIES: beta-lactamase regulator AmpE [unclassified Pseudoalteromonas]NWL14454.1 beta-lactamase regulator AmpE [Pseudoalteromonas sp. Scap03]QLE82466.1 beta-lactamase regulator AmpE [Pseudoalteromonas sp. Scap25]QLE90408.1 beta-lactamase regulator AmpE [Pseudoalteromonas sp. Scap06]TMP66705.1 regulatory signaling modulator protein AmpE [Pseudoalteromonas sp. S1609]CAD2225742.1 Regulatory protein AmpE [Pseudoalteromonas sp. 3J6]